MSRMSHISDSDHRKLEATVLPDCVVESHQVSDTARGWRKVQITKLWRTERVLGHGAFGEVLLQALDNDREKKRALKVIRGLRMTQDEFQRELTAMIEFTKPKYQAAAVFVEFFGWFQNPNDYSMYLAMEYMRGGDLETNLLDLESSTKGGPAISESEIKDITSQILEGLKIMHAEGFAHRDLKPKNIFVVQRDPQWWVKLGDFGLSKQQTEGTAYRTQAGTESYMAPERYYYVPGLNEETSEYTNAVDIWALGCIVYRTITRAVPFPSLLSLRNYAKCKGKLLFKAPAPTAEAEAFIQNLLASHPAERPTASTALEHIWIMTDTEANPTYDYTTLNPTSKIVTESQGGFNSASHPGLQSYRPPPEISHTSTTSSCQEVTSKSSPEPTSDVNSTQRPLSRSGNPRPSLGSQNSSLEVTQTLISSNSEGNMQHNSVEPLVEKETDDKAKNQEGQVVLLVAADNGGKASLDLSLIESDSDAGERLQSSLSRHETPDEDNDQNGKTTKSRTEKGMAMQVETSNKIFVANASKAGVEEIALGDQDEDEGEDEVATILPLPANVLRQAEINGCSQGPKHTGQISTRSYTAQNDIAQREIAIRLLLKNGFDVKQNDFNKEKALRWAARRGQETTVQLLLEKGADIEAKGVDGWTALHRAAKNGHESVVQLLLMNGADIEAKGVDGWTALHHAPKCGHKSVVQLLLKEGAEIEAKDVDRWTTLHLAASKGHESVVQLLLKEGAEIEAKNKNGHTALHLAAGWGHESIVQLLLKEGAEIEAKNNDGRTALHYAASEGHESVVQLLLKERAEIEAEDKNGHTALHYAASKGCEGVVQLLLKEGVNIIAKGRTGSTALNYATTQGHKAVSDLLRKAQPSLYQRMKKSLA